MYKDLLQINTEGQFEFRIKPGIVHVDQHVCRATEELQKAVVMLKDMIEKLEKRIEIIEKDSCEKTNCICSQEDEEEPIQENTVEEEHEQKQQEDFDKEVENFEERGTL